MGNGPEISAVACEAGQAEDRRPLIGAPLRTIVAVVQPQAVPALVVLVAVVAGAGMFSGIVHGTALTLPCRRSPCAARASAPCRWGCAAARRRRPPRPPAAACPPARLSRPR